MSVEDRARALDALWRLESVLAADGPGVGMPMRVLDELRQVLGCDVISFNSVDGVRHRHRFMQEVGEDDRYELLEPQPDEREVLFWLHYPGSPCAEPDRSADLTHVLIHSDVISQRQWHQHPLYLDDEPGQRVEHEMMALWSGGAPGCTYRLLCSRFGGSDFTEDDRFLLELLRPHLLAAYECAAAERARLTGIGPEALTARQREVLECASVGLTNHAIGRRLGISEGTVRTHLQNAYATLGVSSRTAAVRSLPIVTPAIFGIPGDARQQRVATA